MLPPFPPFICAILPAAPPRSKAAALIPNAPSLTNGLICPPAPFALRPMALDDVDEVMAIESLVYTRPWSARGYRHELTHNDLAHYQVLTVGAYNHTPIVGYIGYWLVLDEAHISTVVIHPEWRGQGLGELLLLSALYAAIAQGAATATLEVRRSNLVAQLLYQKYGFEVVGERLRYYHDNHEDALIMTLTPLDERVQADLAQKWENLRRRLHLLRLPGAESVK